MPELCQAAPAYLAALKKDPASDHFVISLCNAGDTAGAGGCQPGPGQNRLPGDAWHGNAPGRPHRGRRRGGRLRGRSLFRSCCQVRLQEKPKRFIRLMDVLSTYNEVQVSMQAFVREVIG